MDFRRFFFMICVPVAIVAFWSPTLGFERYVLLGVLLMLVVSLFTIVVSYIRYLLEV
jgi:hypothetical protein